MRVIKRNSEIVNFNKDKIIQAISKAFVEVDGQLYETDTPEAIAKEIESINTELLDVEDIQDLVEESLMASERKDVARAYVRYRYKKELLRKANTTDQSIKELLDGDSEYWNKENSNKNAKVVTTQRDYMAGITSTDITRRLLLPKDVVKAHDEGIIHFHDADYFAQNALHNCELLNLNDVLQNGTMVNGVLIEKPHSLLTAATIATQVIAAVTSSSYGGCTISLTHLAPFVRISHQKYVRKYARRNLTNNQIAEYANQDLQEEIKAAVQTFNYQTNSMTNTNG